MMKKYFVFGFVVVLAACGSDVELTEDRADVIALQKITRGEIVVELGDPAFEICEEIPASSSGEWVLRQSSYAVLESYCVYAWRSVDEPPDYGPFEALGVGYSQDHPLVMPLFDQANGGIADVDAFKGERLENTLRPAFFDAYRRHVRIPNRPPVVQVNPDVHIALVDATPEGAPQPRSLHATTLAALAESTLCAPTGACAAKVTKYLALPRVNGFRADRVNGGHYGTLFDLAEGIVDAVESTPSGEKLIINLSLGWEEFSLDPNLPANHMAIQLTPGAAYANGVPIPIAAVHRALVFARCKGALIYAAAGNDLLVRQSGGRMFPGSFADLDAPTAAECTAIFGYASPRLPVTGPLLYAVGGVDHADRPIGNTLEGSIPELVATAASATPASGGAILTGTSVAAMTASAVAGMVWAIAPNVDPDVVHALLRDSAVKLDDTASLFYGEVGDEFLVKRVSACDAAEQACASRGGPCSAVVCPARTPAYVDRGVSREVFAKARARTGGTNLDLRRAYNGYASFGSCLRVRQLQSRANWSCPLDAEPAARQLAVGPQPLNPICPACYVDRDPSDVKLTMSVVPEVPGGEVINVMVLVRDGDGGEDFLMVPSPVAQGFQGMLQLGPANFAGPVVKATLLFDYREGNTWYSAGEPLIVPKD